MQVCNCSLVPFVLIVKCPFGCLSFAFLWSLCIQEHRHCDILSCSWSSMCDLTILKPCCDSYAYDLDVVHFETLILCTALLSGNPHVTESCLISSLPKCNMHPINFVSASERICKWCASLPDMLWYLSVVINLNGSHMGNKNICNWSQNLNLLKWKLLGCNIYHLQTNLLWDRNPLFFCHNFWCGLISLHLLEFCGLCA